MQLFLSTQSPQSFTVKKGCFSYTPCFSKLQCHIFTLYCNVFFRSSRCNLSTHRCPQPKQNTRNPSVTQPESTSTLTSRNECLISSSSGRKVTQVSCIYLEMKIDSNVPVLWSISLTSIIICFGFLNKCKSQTYFMLGLLLPHFFSKIYTVTTLFDQINIVVT